MYGVTVVVVMLRVVVVAVVVVTLIYCCSYSYALHGVVVAVIVLCAVLQLWWLALEGEGGCASVGKGGGKWESTV